MTAPLLAIMTPIPIEWETMCTRLTGARDVRGLPFLAKIGRLGDYRVVCLQSGKGQGSTAAALELVCSRWKPSVIVLCGIAGGFPDRGGREPGRGPRRGDVVVANHVYHLDFGKLAGGIYTHRPDEDYNPNPLLREKAELFKLKNPTWAAQIGVPRPDGQPPSDTRVVFGYVGSGSTVVDDPSHPIFRARLDGIPEIDAVEMEACGAATAASRRHVRLIIMRGISDEPRSSPEATAGSQQREDWKAYAAAASATFVKGFLSAFPDLAADPVRTYAGFRSLESAISAVFAGRRRVNRPLVDDLLTRIMTRDAVLVEGGKGSGKSSMVILALLQYRNEHGRAEPPILYLNAEDLRIVGVLGEVHRAIRELPEDALLFLDDVHRNPREATQAALAAFREYRGKLVVASRSVNASDDYERLRGEFLTADSGVTRELVDLSHLVTDADLRDLIRRTIIEYGKSASEDEIEAFLRCYRGDLPALFDAIEEWLPATPVDGGLADRRLRARLERDPDFEVDGLSRDRALACFLAVAASWQFELPTKLEFLSVGLGLDWKIPRRLAELGVLKEGGDYGLRTYELQHELVAQRYVRIGAPSDFSSYLRQRFAQSGISNAHDSRRLAAHMLLMEVLSSLSSEDQVERLRQLNNAFTYRGYGPDYIDMTGVFRDNERLVGAASRVEILASGGGIRRRRGNPREAEEWLVAALEADTQAGGKARGRILYEQAYLTYYRNEFEDAEKRFFMSADASSSEVGREISLTKAVEARFQGLVLHDLFVRNLRRPAKERGRFVDLKVLEDVRARLAAHLSRFEELASAPRLVKSEKENAARWISNCLLHLADVSIEIGDVERAKTYLNREAHQLQAANHLTVKPVLEYLGGRLALIGNDNQKAVQLLDQAFREYRRLQRDEGLADVVVTLGDALLESGESHGALDMYREAASHVDPNRRNLRGVSAARKRLEMSRKP